MVNYLILKIPTNLSTLFKITTNLQTLLKILTNMDTFLEILTYMDTSRNSNKYGPFSRNSHKYGPFIRKAHKYGNFIRNPHTYGLFARNSHTCNEELPIRNKHLRLTVIMVISYWLLLLRLQNCVRSGTPPVLENATEDNTFLHPPAAWVRCSAADLYFTRDPKVNYNSRDMDFSLTI